MPFLIVAATVMTPLQLAGLKLAALPLLLPAATTTTAFSGGLVAVVMALWDAESQLRHRPG